MATVNLNTKASALIGDNAKVRIRMIDNVLQILPTNRVKGSNLPKGELLVELRDKKSGNGTVAKRFKLPAEMEVALGSMFRAEVGKHGWISLVTLTADERIAVLTPVGGPRPAGASVTEK